MQASQCTESMPVRTAAERRPGAFERLFLEHPREVGESYLEHLGHSAGYGWRVLKISCFCFIHALIPGIFKTAASSRICAMADELDDRAQLAREERCRQSGSYDPGL